MAISYSNFTFDDVAKLQLTLRTVKFFTDTQIPEFQPSELLTETLATNLELRLGTEKAKSELLVTPILVDLWRNNRTAFTLFSGYTFDVDKEQGLVGRCDYILSGAADNPRIEAPLLAIVEAKNDNIDDAVPQCAAQMLAAKIFNERKGKVFSMLYGAVTNGFEWMFLRLSGSTVEIDKEIYQLRNLPELLGVLQHIINYYKEHSSATSA